MLEGYPDALIRLLGDLPGDDFAHEPKTTCARCALWPPTGDDPAGVRTFSTVRCCTYHPRIPNFMVGRALLGGGEVAERFRRRLADRDGVDDMGIQPPRDHQHRYASGPDELFGHDLSLACPFWVEGPLSCGIHGFRGAVCRTWHCRHDAGERGLLAWDALRVLLREIELLLAEQCSVRSPRPWPWSPDAEWERFFEACARTVDALEPAVLHEIARRTTGRRIDVHTMVARRDAPLPERLKTNGHVVEPSVTGAWRVAGYSIWDPVEAPAEVGVLLSVLAPGGDWREAVEEVERRTGRRLAASLIRALWCAEVLVSEGARARKG